MVRGELAIQVKCQKVKVTHQLQKQHRCYESLPVQGNVSSGNHELFLDPISRILQKGSKRLPCTAAMHGFQADDGCFYRASPVLAMVEKPTKSILEPELQTDTFSGKELYSQQQLKRLDDMLSWPEIQQQPGDPNPRHDLSQPI